MAERVQAAPARTDDGRQRTDDRWRTAAVQNRRYQRHWREGLTTEDTERTEFGQRVSGFLLCALGALCGSKPSSVVCCRSSAIVHYSCGRTSCFGGSGWWCLSTALLRARLRRAGCFWHGCPRHYTRPKARRAFWDAKIAANRARDRRIDRALRAAGWRVLHVWEHALAPRLLGRTLARVRRAVAGDRLPVAGRRRTEGTEA